MTRRQFEPQSVGAVLAHVNRGAGLQVVAPPTVEVDPKTRDELDRLFVRIKAICPGWRSSWPNEEVEKAAKAEWLAEIIRQQVTRREQLQAGVRALSAQARPLVPSAGQFCAWCWAPEVFGLPTLDDAYREALANTHPAMVGAAKWSCPAVYWLPLALGSPGCRLWPEKMGWRRWRSPTDRSSRSWRAGRRSERFRRERSPTRRRETNPLELLPSSSFENNSKEEVAHEVERTQRLSDG